MASGKFVSYVRVSTKRQGESGLGLAAQRESIAQYLNGGDWELLREFEEVESGKVNERPQLAAALKHCERTGATLIVAKLDRLSRDSAFLNNLMASDIKFIIADYPGANKFVLQVFAALAEYERTLISQRTKAALARSKKPKGIKGAANLLKAAEAGRALGQQANAERAMGFTARVGELILEHKRMGLNLTQTAERLNADQILTSRGFKKGPDRKPTGERLMWTAAGVQRVLRKFGREGCP